MTAEPRDDQVSLSEVGAVLRLEGEIDATNGREVGERILAHCDGQPGNPSVDCSGLTFLDSSGLHAFVTVHHALRMEGRRLVLVGLDGACRRAFEITGLLELFDEPEPDETDPLRA